VGVEKPQKTTKNHGFKRINNSAEDCLILFKFGEDIDHVVPDVQGQGRSVT